MKRQRALAEIEKTKFDLVIIGGGATGTGIALDAASRGLSVFLAERGDFASGTSSRSTKLIHGGVRYLELAVKNLDLGQYSLVKEALSERTTLIEIAPHLVHWLAIMTPLYRTLDIPYFLMGLKLYDQLASGHLKYPSRYMKADEVMAHCPSLKRTHLKGAVVYYDGQFDDSRMNLALARTAAEEGAQILNYFELESFQFEGRLLKSARFKDKLSGGKYTVRGRAFINATGPYADTIRRLSDPSSSALLKASSGSHIVLPGNWCPKGSGILIPKTDDGRVLFALPWQKHTVVGTTDNPCPVVDEPTPSSSDISYMVRQLARYFTAEVTPSDVLASWSGIRPLVSHTEVGSTAKLSREHVILTDPSGLITIAGGKWTTYRIMAQDTVEEAIRQKELVTRFPCRTASLRLVGARQSFHGVATRLKKKYGLEADTIRHLLESYGSEAIEVAQIGLNKKLHPDYPYIESQLLFSIEREGACFAEDILDRRLRLGFLNQSVTQSLLPTIRKWLEKTHQISV